MGIVGSASRAGGLGISKTKLERLRPWWFGWKGVVTAISNFIGPPINGSLSHVRAQLKEGDANAAVLLEVDPPLVAAYSEDLDAVALLTFPPGSVDVAGLSPGEKLVAVNVYQRSLPPEADLQQGPAATGAWDDFSPIIGEFVSEDSARLEELRQLIPEAAYARCSELAADYRRRNPGKARDGRPGYGGVRALYGKQA